MSVVLGIALLACGGDTREPRGSSAGTGGSAASSGGTAGAGTGGTRVDGGGTGGAGGAEIDLSCTNPRPVVGIDGVETGFVDCEAAGFLHRPERRVCPSIVPRPNPIAEPVDGSNGCIRDQDCGDLLQGHCVVTVSPGFPPSSSTICIPGCLRDEDCGPGYVCMCGDPVGRCVQAGCSTDTQCGDGLLCSSTQHIGGCGESYQGPFACQTPSDECGGARDCVVGQYCETTPSGRACAFGGGACGQ